MNCSAAPSLFSVDKSSTRIIVGEKAAALMTLVVNCIFTQIVAVVGCSCNLITVLVLRRDGYKDPTNLLLLSLAIWDLLFLLSLWLRKLRCPVAYIAELLGGEENFMFAKRYNAYVTVYGVFPFYRTAMFVSMMHVVVMTFQRFLVVCFPLKVSQWVTVRSMMTVLVSLYVTSFAMFAPFFPGQAVGSAFDHKYNRTFPIFEFSTFYETNLQIMTVYNSGFVSIVRGPLSYFLVIFLSTVIVYKLSKADQKRSAMMSSNSAHGVKVTRMLLVVCAVYVGCSSPSFMLFPTSFFVPWFGIGNAQFYLFLDVEELLQAINSSANFFIYILMSKKFYNTCRDLMLCACNSSSRRAVHQ
ncbi:neuropeptides capa receptor-like [Aplysia californica]|uniref:Neuropeptides capa receptor-like n=1 Tax=Aplysia californica TaxID=6500 RepID=A0ABM0JVJ0_APLCA|nr:neuropeptides capa receptor-like [Aplysia californica]